MSRRPRPTAAGSLLDAWAGPALSILLIVVAAAREGGRVSVSAANALALLLTLAGIAWAVRSSGRQRRLCELYLWLAFVLTVGYLHLIAAGLAELVAVDEAVAFRALAVAHLAVTGLVLWRLGTWSLRDRVGSGRAAFARLAAGLLVVGAVIFWIGARTFTGMTLEAVSGDPEGHMWTAANFLIATLVTLAGLKFLARALEDAGGGLLPSLGLGAFAFGAVFWVLHLTLRLTVVRQAAEAYRLTGVAPDWYAPWPGWTGLLFGIYSVLAYLGTLLFGLALLRTRLLARWVGWFTIVASLLLLPLVGPPLFIHALLWVVGIVMLRPPPDGLDARRAGPPSATGVQVSSKRPISW